jgi:hypothetical protein
MKDCSLTNKIISQWNLRNRKKEFTDLEKAEIALETIREHEQGRAKQIAAYYLWNSFDEKEKRTIETILSYAENLSAEDIV